MENQNQTTRPSGLSGRGLRIWGMIFILAGVVGRSIFQNQLLGMGQMSGQELLALMNATEDAMLYATIALILQAVQSCAIPIFSFLLLEGFLHTASFKKYVLKVVGLAVISEIPFNLAMGGKLMDMSSRNPVFGLVVCLVVLYLFRHYSEVSMQNRLIKAIVIFAALIWSTMLKIDSAAAMIIVVCVLWAFRKKALFRNIAGCTAAVVCTVISPFYLASPMGFMAVHFYNGEPDEGHWLIRYLAYPVLLLAVALIALFGI